MKVIGKMINMQGEGNYGINNTRKVNNVKIGKIFIR